MKQFSSTEQEQDICGMKQNKKRNVNIFVAYSEWKLDDAQKMHTQHTVYYTV